MAQGLYSGINAVINSPVSAWQGIKSAVASPNPWDVPALRSGEIYLTQADREAARQAEAQAQNERNKTYEAFDQYLASMPQEQALQPAVQEAPQNVTTPQLSAPVQNQQPQFASPQTGAAGGEPNIPNRPLTVQEQLAQAYQEQQALQSQAIKQAEEQLAAARNKPQKMDLTPLIALAEGWSQQPIGLLRAYQAPQDQAKTVQALQEAVLKARGGASELARMRAKDVAQLQEMEEARKQRLQEIEMRKSELGMAKADREGAKKEKLVYEQRQKFGKEYGNQIVGLSEMAQNAKIARDIIAKKGRLPVFGDPEFTDYQSAVSSMLTRYNADKAKLGALAGADLRLLESAVGTSADSFGNLVKNVAGGGAAGSIKVLDRLLKGTDQTVENIGKRVKSEYMPEVKETFDIVKGEYSQSRGLSQQPETTQFTPEQVSKMTDEEVRANFNRIYGGK